MTKRYLSLAIIAFLFALSGSLNAQIIKGEVFGGASLSQIDGDECFGYKRFNGVAGVGALVPITNWLDVALEVEYNPKGAYRPDTLDASSGTYPYVYDCKLNYVEIPLMFYLTDKNRYTLGIGASFGRLVGLSEKNNGIETDITVGDGCLRWPEGYTDGYDLSYIKSNDDLNNPDFYMTDIYGRDSLILRNSNTYKRNDFNICADFRIRIWEGLHLQLRYQYSLAPIRTRLFTVMDSYISYNIRQQHNNQISLRVTYIFGEDRSKLNKEIQKEEQRQRR